MHDRFPRGKAALVLAHPGHELRCYHWFEQARPLVYVLTDGSGHHGTSRLGSTTTLLRAVGATRGSIYGRFPDRVLYQALLGQDDALLQALASELAEGLLRAEIDYVVADNADLGEKMGINSTPTLYVNGRQILGAMPFEVFKQVIDEELAKKP